MHKAEGRPSLPRSCRGSANPSQLFKVPPPIKNLPIFGLSSPLPGSCPASPSASLGQGKGLSSTESPPCPGTTGTSRLGLICLLPGAASLSLWMQLRAGGPWGTGSGSAPSSSCAEHRSFCQTQGSAPSTLTLCAEAGTSAYKFSAGTEDALLIPGASSAFDNISA